MPTTLMRYRAWPDPLQFTHRPRLALPFKLLQCFISVTCNAHSPDALQGVTRPVTVHASAKTGVTFHASQMFSKRCL